jgi:hypothetical protein
MPPKPLSPGSPEANHAAACSDRSETISSKSRATIKEAKRGESEHPWLTPSFMSSVRHVSSSHLWWTVFCLMVEKFVRHVLRTVT